MGYLFLFLCGVVQSFASEMPTQKIFSLPDYESRPTQLFHEGSLWEGQVWRENTVAQGIVRSFSPTGNLIHTIIFPHTVTFLKAINANSLLAVGKGVENGARFSAATTLNIKDLSLQTVRLPRELFISDVLPDGMGGFYFGDVGDYGVGRFFDGKLEYFNARVVSAGLMISNGGFLFVVEQNSSGKDRSNIVEFNLRKKTVRRFWNANALPLSLLNLTFSPNQKTLYAANTKEDEVLMIDISSGKILRRLSVPGYPRGLALSQGKLLVLSEDTSEIHTFASEGRGREEEPWKITFDGLPLVSPGTLTPVNNGFFVRANRPPCVGCIASNNGVFNFSVSERRTSGLN